MPSLYDMIARHSVYLERVKNWYVSDFEKYLTRLERELRAFIAANDSGGNMGELTARAWRRLLRQLDKVQDAIYSRYMRDLLAKLRTFFAADLDVQRGIFSHGRRRKVGADLESGTMWAKVKATVIPATTELPTATISQWVTSAKELVTKAFKQGYIDSKKYAEVLQDLVGTAEQKLKDGVINKIRNGANAMVDAVVQHTTSVIGSVLGAEVYNYYQWVSVIDSRTTTICTMRDLMVYPVGEGPLPPAHRRCRSRIVPCDADGSDASDRGFKEWFRAQAEAFRRNVYPGNADDVDTYTDIRDNEPLDPRDFQTVLQFITAD